MSSVTTSKLNWVWRSLMVFAMIGAFFSGPSPTQASNIVGYGEYYIMGTEADILDVLTDIPNGSVPGTATIHTRLSIVASANGVNIYLDEAEDGYDFDPASPYSTADARWDATGDDQGPALSRGQVLTLDENNTYVTGSNGVGGGDRFYVTGAPVSVVRTVWPSSPGPYLAGSWELYPVQRWQSEYTVPIGQDTDFAANTNPFLYTFLFIETQEDNTRVVVTDPISGELFNGVIDQGENILIKNTNEGATVVGTEDGTSNPRNIQAGIITSSNGVYDARYYTMTPEQYLCNEYYLPVPSLQFPNDELGARNIDTAVYIYSFQNGTNVSVESATGTTNLTMAQGELQRYVMPRMPRGTTTGDYGVRIITDDLSDTIWALVAGDDDRPDVDWGYQGLCVDYLSDDYFLPYAPANPAHITPVDDNTEFFVDWNSDGTVDSSFVLDRYETNMIYDTGDNDASGAHIFADGLFTVAWGQDNTEQTPGEQAHFPGTNDLDFGYVILPTFWSDPVLGIDKSVTPTILPAVGGTASFTVVVHSEDAPVYILDVIDVLPTGWAYVNNSANISLSYATGGAYNPSISGQTLTWDLGGLGLNDTMPVNGVITITYQTQTTSGFSTGANVNTAEAYGSSIPDDTDNDAAIFRPVDSAIVTLSGTDGQVYGHLYFDANGNGVQDASELDLANVDVIITESGGGTQTVSTDADGNWIATVPAGSTTANVDETDVDFPANAVQTEGTDPTTVNVTAGSSTDAGIDGYYVPLGGIGNFVWLDENGDGVQDAGEAGIPNVTVNLYDSANNLVAATTTDANGGYRFSDVEVGTYSVRVDTTSLPSSLVANPTYDEDGSSDSQSTVSLTTDGQEYMTADFGYNWVPANDSDNPGAGATGALGDRIWNDADGDGVQDSGEAGISGVIVRLLTDDNGDGVYGGTGDNPATTATTDAAGNYIFDGLAPAAYVVEVDDSTLPAFYNPTPTGDPDSDGDNTSNPIVIAPGDVFVNADFGYTAAGDSSTIGDTIFVDANADGVQNGSDPGIPGVTIALLNNSGNVIATTVTDANGQYDFFGLGAGDYTVWVNDTHNVLGELVPVSDADGGNDNQSSTTVDGTNDDLDQDYGYAPSNHDGSDGLIGDTIFIDTDGSNDWNAGEGVEGVTVNLYDVSGTNLLATTTSNENGQYFFGDLDSSATYQVRVDNTGLLSGLNNFIDPDGGTAHQSTVDLSTSGGVNLSQDFGYNAGTPNAVGGTIWNDTNADGTLLGETGRFVGVTVVLYDSNGDIVATTVTDGNGDYSFTNLPDGTYTVDVADDANLLNGYWHSDGPNDGSDNNSQDDPYSMTVNGGAMDTTGDFGYYVEPAALGDYVWNDMNQDGIQDAGESGIPNATVTLVISYPNGDAVTVVTTTDSSGYYSFGNLLLDESFNATGGAGQPSYQVTFTRLSGYTASPTNQGDGSNDSRGMTNNPAPVQGQTIENVDSGFYATVEIGDRLWIDQDGDGVQDAGEPGLVGVTVELDTGSCTLGSDCPTATTDANGNYLFSNLPGGPYAVVVQTATLPGGVTQTGDPDGVLDNQHLLGTFAPGSYLDVDFGYQGASSIGNYVWNDTNGDGTQDTGEAGISGVTVSLYDASGTNLLAITTTDANGEYNFPGLPYGTYQVQVVQPAGTTQTSDPDVVCPGVSCDNSTGVTLDGTTPNVDTADFGYQYTALSISKTSDSGGDNDGQVNPGDTINYTIVVRNNTASPHTNIAITDPLPAGTIYVAQSTVASTNSPAANNYARDEFSTQSYARQDGDGVLNWAADWVENDPYGGGAVADGGYVYIGTDRLVLDWAWVDSERIERSIDLSSYTTAQLSFDWETIGLDAGDCVAIRIYNGSSWTTLTTFTDSQSATYSVDITSYISNDTRVRFANEDTCNQNWDNGEYAYFDDVQITATSPGSTVTLDNIPGGANPDLSSGVPANLVQTSDNFGLSPGQSMQVTFQVTVDNPVAAGLSSIDNTASVVSVQQPTPVEDSTSDDLPPANIGNYVWYDDGDGLQGGTDDIDMFGITVDLYDPGPDGNIGGGDDVLVDSTTTASDGSYAFTNIPADSYYLDFDLPTGYSFTTQNVGSDDTVDSDVDASGQTAVFGLTAGETNNDLDAGLANSNLDYGDLPSTYNRTVFGHDGPRHNLGTMHLGENVDADPDGQEHGGAAGDNYDDGVLRNMNDNWTNGAVVELFIEPQGSTASGLADVGVWIDWNGDGVFAAGEFFAFSGLTFGASNTAQITVPDASTYTVGDIVNVRVRAFDPASVPGGSLDGNDYSGFASNGEVEDYQWDFDSPNAVNLAEFFANTAGFPTWVIALAALVIAILAGTSVSLLKTRKQTTTIRFQNSK